QTFSIFLDECDLPTIYFISCTNSCFTLSLPETFACCDNDITSIYQFYAKERKWSVNLSKSDIVQLYNSSFSGCNMKKMKLVPADVQVKLLRNQINVNLPTDFNYGYNIDSSPYVPREINND